MSDDDQWWWQQDIELQRLEFEMKQRFAIALLLLLGENYV